MPKFFSLRYSKIVSFILSTTFSVTETCPSKRFSYVSIATSLFSIFIHPNTKSTVVLYIQHILEERSKAFLKVFLIDVNRIRLPRRPPRFYKIYYYNIFKVQFQYTNRKLKQQNLSSFTYILERCPKDVLIASLKVMSGTSPGRQF